MSSLAAVTEQIDDVEHAQRMFKILGNPVAELRALYGDGRKPWSNFYDRRTCEGFAETAAGLSGKTEGIHREFIITGVYMTINRLDEEFAGAAVNALDLSTKSKNIARRTTLFIDIDPHRDHPDGGDVCSTDTEHDAALRVAEKAVQFAKSLGWAEPLVVDSGNGAYLFFGIDLPNDKVSKELVQAVVCAFADELNTEAVHVDLAVTDAARIARVAGSVNRKSVHTQQRPNRTAAILSAPADDRLEVVTVEQLRALVGAHGGATNGQPPAASIAPQLPHPDFAKEHLEADHPRRVEAMQKYLEHLNIKPTNIQTKDEFTQFDFSECLVTGESHRDNRNMAVLVWKGGNIGVNCFHEKHKDHTWSDVQKQLGLSFKDFVEGLADQAIGGESERAYNDPLWLADRHLQEHATPDGTPTYAFFLGDTYRFDDEDGWQKTTEKEEGPWIRETIQNAFDEYARIQSQLEGKKVKPKPVRGALIADTFKAIQQRCKRDVSIRTEPPFWLEPYDWKAEDLLCFRNGILNLRRYIEGSEDYFLAPMTPKLFSEHRATFDFDPAATKRNEWDNFLKSLEKEDDWYALLQQIMGYSLWLGYDLQKFFQIVGPPRSGKGTIAHVTQNLVGGKPAVCTPGLKHFADEFGLEQAIGKRLALVPEIKVSSRLNVTDVVQTLNAITGGDGVTVCRKHKRNIPMHLRMKIWMLTNNFVVLPDNSGALNARVIPLKLTKSFRGKEDFELADKLQGEYPAILIWALKGLRTLWEAGGRFTLPKSTQDELERLLAESAPLHDFVEQCCDVNLTKGVQCKVLYKVYRRWCQDDNNKDYLDESEFAGELSSTVSTITKKRATKERQRERDDCQIVSTPADDKTGRPQFWLGICPKPEWRTKQVFKGLRD